MCIKNQPPAAHYHPTTQQSSSCLEFLIRQDIANWRHSSPGIIVIDPHGALFDSLAAYVRAINWQDFDEINARRLQRWNAERATETAERIAEIKRQLALSPLPPHAGQSSCDDTGGAQ